VAAFDPSHTACEVGYSIDRACTPHSHIWGRQRRLGPGRNDSHGKASQPQLSLGCSDGQSFPDRRVEMRAVRRPASNSGRDSPTGNHSENPQLSRPAIPCATFEACCSRRLSKLLLALIQYTCALPSQHARSTIRSLTVFAAPQHAGLNSPAQVGPGQHRTSGHNPDLCDSLDGTPPLKTAIRKILLTGTQLP